MSGPEGWLPMEVTLTLYVNPTADADGRHEIITPGGGGTLRAWLTPSEFEGRFGVPMPRPPRVGPLGLSEEETRAWARGTCDSTRCLLTACRDAVAEWDAEGER